MKNNKKPWKRTELIFCVIVIWTAALFQAYALYQEKKEEEETLAAFQTLELSAVEGCVEITAAIGKNYEKESGKELFLTGLIRELNLAEEMEFVREEKNGRAEILYLKEAEGERIKIAFVTESTDTEYQYVHILYEIENNVEQLLQYKTKIERLLKMRNLTATSNLNLKGSRNGKMSLNEKKEITDRLFQSLNASVVEAVREEDLYTVYGYSDLLQNSFSYGENEINLNLAFSYQEEAAKTVFYLAMPYVQIDY